MKKKNNNQKPLTLDALVSYNQEVLFPWMQERFVAKTDFNELKTDFSGLKMDFNELKTDFSGLKMDFNELKTDFNESKTEFSDFKNESLTNQDAMLKKLDILLTEKTVREHQEKKEKKLWAIIIKALQEHRILSPRELEEIAQLEIF